MDKVSSDAQKARSLNLYGAAYHGASAEKTLIINTAQVSSKLAQEPYIEIQEPDLSSDTLSFGFKIDEIDYKTSLKASEEFAQKAKYSRQARVSDFKEMELSASKHEKTKLDIHKEANIEFKNLVIRALNILDDGDIEKSFISPNSPSHPQLRPLRPTQRNRNRSSFERLIHIAV